MKIAQKIAQTSQPVVALGKRFFYRQLQMSRDDAYRLAAYVPAFIVAGFILVSASQVD